MTEPRSPRANGLLEAQGRDYEETSSPWPGQRRGVLGRRRIATAWHTTHVVERTEGEVWYRPCCGRESTVTTFIDQQTHKRVPRQDVRPCVHCGIQWSAVTGMILTEWSRS